MLFPTVEFAVFFTIVFVGSWLLRPFPVGWKLFILAASYFFYGWWEPRFTLLLAGSTVANWVFGEVIDRFRGGAARRAALIVAVVVNLAVLGYFKYYGFFVDTVVQSLGKIGLHPSPPLIQVILPIGISFFTFHALSYVIDIYRRDAKPAVALDFAVYMSFFPHLVAGPIVRPTELIPQLRTKADPRAIEAALAFRLIFAGLFKKVVISSYVATAIVDPVFAVPKAHSGPEVLFAVYGYAVQIYADFSGYTDIAIGLALLLGIRFPQNFNAPYTSLSIQDFWRRWHMTLSRWLRDYVYVPLGGNRGTTARVRRNLLLTMVIGGLWHGAAWTFVAWGAIHGSALVLERVRDDRLRAAGRPVEAVTVAQKVGRWLITFNVVCFAWVFFRSETFTTAKDMLSRLIVGWGEPSPLLNPLLVFTIVASIGVQFVPAGAVDRVQVGFSRLAPVLQGIALAFAFVMIGVLGPQGVAPFIYFQF